MRTKRIILFISLGLVVPVGCLYGLLRVLSRPTGPITSARLADGRILRIEGVTYGKQHRMGKRSLLEPIEPWLPRQVAQLLAPQHRPSEVTMDEPGLVVWVNAVDPVTRKYVDCQQIRMEFVDEHGDLFGQETSSWSGSPNFWRCGHIFQAFPRTQRTLTLQVSCWRQPGPPVRMEFPNPCMTAPAAWTARPLPQRVRAGELEVELSGLLLRTNGGPKQYWQTPGQYWEPVWKLFRRGEEAAGWDEAQWAAADPSGNRGQFLGTHQPVLRFSAEFFPSPTNLADTTVLGRLAPVSVAPLQSNAWAEVALAHGSAPVTVLGLFPPGMYVFTGGRFETNPAIRMGRTIGGAPSGWVGQSKRVSPTRTMRWAGHCTPVPVVYMRAPASGSKGRLGLRLCDQQGRYWLARPEPQGAADGVWPFLVELPSDVTRVSAEVVLLKPIQAEFTVQTPPTQAADPGRTAISFP